MALSTLCPSTKVQTLNLIQDVMNNVKTMIEEKNYNNELLQSQKFLLRSAFDKLYSECMEKKDQYMSFLALKFKEFNDTIFPFYNSEIKNDTLNKLYSNLKKLLEDVQMN